MIEGVDYSRTPHALSPSVAALKAAGKHFVGRYAVYDKSPNGRGITAAEYQRMVMGGIDVFLYWQTTTNWMLDGFAAGVAGAQNAQANIIGAGMPPGMPVYFACDFDATPAQQAAIEDCLAGAASVLGFDRVGLYAGYWPLQRAMQNKACRWFCQTSAWSGGMILEGIHLYQYDYNQYVDGTNCDWVRAYQENYGQASRFVDPVIPEEVAPQPSPIWWEPGDDWGPQARTHDGAIAWAFLGEVRAKRDVPLRKDASPLAEVVHRLKTGDAVRIVGTYKAKNKTVWAMLEYAPGKVGRAVLSAFNPYRWPTV